MLAARTTVRPVTTANMAAAPGRGHQPFDLKSGQVLAVAVLTPRASIPRRAAPPPPVFLRLHPFIILSKVSPAGQR
jgi:hypothetical protein